MKAVLDMDPGIDDAVALLIAFNNPELEIVGITTVSGNVNVNKSTYNVLRILNATGKKITVAAGADKPLFKRPIHVAHIHGSDGLGNCELKAKRVGVSNAQKFLYDIISMHKRKETNILATGPLTNIALMIDNDASLLNKINKIVIMGGVYGLGKHARGNVSPYAEFNIYSDPEAAEIVFNSDRTIDAVGLDVTMHPDCAIDKAALNVIGKLRGKSAVIASKILSYPVRRYRIFHLHDVFALARLLHPNMFKATNCRVNVNKLGKFRGRCVLTLKKGNVNVCSDVDPSLFIKFVMDGLRRQ